MFDPAICKYQLRDGAVYWLLIPAAIILSGKWADRLLDLPGIPFSTPLAIIALVMLGGGLALIRLSMLDLAAAGGTPNPLRPPKKIVTAGSYALCRHPMFLGYDLCALAVILFLGSPGMLGISFPVFLLWEIRFLRKEEKILRRRFKQPYADYVSKTPFLLPLPFRRQIKGRHNPL